jgi:hypothetical protein
MDECSRRLHQLDNNPVGIQCQMKFYLTRKRALVHTQLIAYSSACHHRIKTESKECAASTFCAFFFVLFSPPIYICNRMHKMRGIDFVQDWQITCGESRLDFRHLLILELFQTWGRPRLALYTYMHTYIHTYIYTYTNTHIHTYEHTPHIHTYMHTYIHTYIHTYVRTS